MLNEQPYPDGRLPAMLQAAFPQVIAYFEHRKHWSFAQVLNELLIDTPDISAPARQAMFDTAGLIYGDKLALSLKDELRARGPVIFAANHGGFENHPMLIASTLLRLMAAGNRANPPLQLFLVCCAINPENSTAPAGFLSARRKANFRRCSVQLVPAKLNKSAILNLPALGADQLLNLDLKERFQAFYPYEQRALKAGAAKLDAGHPALYAQCARFNTRLYQQKLGNGAIPLFLPLEEIAARCLIHDLKAGKGMLSVWLQDHTLMQELLKQLSGITGCWSLPTGRILNAGDRIAGSGSVLFWALNASGRMEALGLYRIEGRLYLANTRLRLPFNAEALIKALKQRHIIPGLFLAYMSLTLDHHLRLSGGIYMSHYYPLMLKLSLKLMPWYPNPDLAYASLVSAALMPFSAELTDGSRHPFSLSDLILKSRFTPEECEAVLSAKVADALAPTLIDMAMDTLDPAVLEPYRACLTRGAGGNVLKFKPETAS